jgi:hypothetical protein
MKYCGLMMEMPIRRIFVDDEMIYFVDNVVV